MTVPALPRFVAFLTTQRYTYIGLTIDPVILLDRLSDYCPAPVLLVGAFPGTWRDERALHAEYQALRARGNSKWFNLLATPPFVADCEEFLRARKAAPTPLTPTPDSLSSDS